MGPGAELPLWDYLIDRTKDAERRAVVLKGLVSIAQTRLDRRSDVISRLTRVLDHSPANEATLNGHIIRLLGRMQAIEAAESIARAFSEDRVDEDLIEPDLVHMLPTEFLTPGL